MVKPYKSDWGNMPMEIDGKYWSVNNSPEQNLNAKYPRLTSSNADNNYVMSDFWLFNGAYFRMKNITFGLHLTKIHHRSHSPAKRQTLLQRFRSFLHQQLSKRLGSGSEQHWIPNHYLHRLWYCC